MMMTSAVTRSITRILSLQTVRDDISSLNRCCSSRVSKWATHTLPISNSHRMLSCHRTRTERLFVVNHGYIYTIWRDFIYGITFRWSLHLWFSAVVERGKKVVEFPCSLHGERNIVSQKRRLFVDETETGSKYEFKPASLHSRALLWWLVRW